MKVSRQLARLEPMVLHPVRGLDDTEWHRAPPGKWSVAQIVQHLAIGVDVVAGTFERRADRSEMQRRSKPYEALLRHLVLGLGTVPGGLTAAKGTEPADQPEPELITAQFRMGVERLRSMTEDWPAERQLARFVRHPYLGDLNLPEWVRFHFLHCRHHARQIEARLEWLDRRM